MKEDAVDRICGTYGGEEKCIQDFGGDTGRIQITWKMKHSW
jgi:hypothetical protein